MRVVSIGLTAVAAVTVALPLLPAFTPRAALACVVGTGMGASCTESALDACLPGGGSFDGTVTFNCGGAATITVTSTKTISADTTIDGGSLITVSGGDSVGVFSVSPDVNFTVQNLTIANGNSASDSGGGISNYGGTLTVTNSTFSGNTSTDGAGGIDNNYGTLTVTNSTVSGNTGYWGGGIGLNAGIGIEASATLTVTNSTVSGNSASYGGGIENGGGMVTVTNSTFSGNVSDGGGGGIENDRSIYNFGGGLTVTNSTFSGNSGSPSGGIFNNNGWLIVTNSTFSGNRGLSGGISTYVGWAGVTNTIIANSTSGGNCYGPVIDGDHNIDDGTTCGFTGTGCTSTTGSSFCNTNPVLDPTGLQNNGGPTQTIALLAGSPAINAGDEAVCAAWRVNNLDQRDYVRPGTGATNCSIGAYEYNSPGTSDCCQCPTSCAAPVNGLCGGCVLVLGATCMSGDLCVLHTPTPTATPSATPTPATPSATPTPTPVLIPGGGRLAGDCTLEWGTDPAPVSGRNGLPATRLDCTDGDPSCDFDGTAGTCTFHVALCLNVQDPRIACTPTDVQIVQVLQPAPGRAGATDTGNRTALETALGQVGGHVQGVCTRPAIHRGQFCTAPGDCNSAPGTADGVCWSLVKFSPALAATHMCTGYAPITVPVRHTARGSSPGTKRLRITAVPSVNPRTLQDTDSLTLICKPHS